MGDELQVRHQRQHYSVSLLLAFATGHKRHICIDVQRNVSIYYVTFLLLHHNDVFFEAMQRQKESFLTKCIAERGEESTEARNTKSVHKFTCQCSAVHAL